MDIYLTRVGGSGDFRFPSLPEKIKASYGTNYETYNIINIGQVMLPRGSKCEKVSWNGTFFGKPRRKLDYLGAWMKPQSCISRLEKWRKKGRVLRLLITETGINMDVTISDFKPSYEGGVGDVPYSIEFVAYRELKMYTTEEMGITSYEAKTQPRQQDSASSNGHCLCSGESYCLNGDDTLWSVSQRCYGSGTLWGDIYDANKDAIETAAHHHGRHGSDHGHWVYAGTQIVLP